MFWHDSGNIVKYIQKWQEKISFRLKQTKQTEIQSLRNKEEGVLKMAIQELIEIFSHMIEPLQMFLLGVGLIILSLIGREMYKKLAYYPQDTAQQEGKRLGIDRRKSYFDVHIPERRSGKERRSGFDRKLKTKSIGLIKTNKTGRAAQAVKGKGDSL